MLSYMRKKAKSWIIVVPVGIIILVFVFFYGFSDVRKSGKDIVIASVGERRITIAEYRTAYRNMVEFYRNVYKNQMTEDMIEKIGLKQQVLEELINREILLNEAEKLDINVTPEEIRKTIVSTPVFQENGIFSQRLYKRVLGFYGISAVDYERDKGKELKQGIVDAVDWTGGIITALALIMAGAFGSMMLSSNAMLREFGFALGVAILLDASTVGMQYGTMKG